MTTATHPGEFTAELTPTATHAARSCRWVPTSPGEWLLVVRQRRAKRETGKVESDVYDVREQSDDGFGVREFLMVNNTDPDRSPVYGVEAVFGIPFRCNCDGFRSHKHCKHADAVRVLLRQLSPEES